MPVLVAEREGAVGLSDVIEQFLFRILLADRRQVRSHPLADALHSMAFPAGLRPLAEEDSTTALDTAFHRKELANVECSPGDRRKNFRRFVANAAVRMIRQKVPHVGKYVI